MKKAIMIIIVVIIVVLIGLSVYLLKQRESSYNNSENMEIANVDSNTETEESIVGDDSLEVGTIERNGFIVDNVFHSRNQGYIHFTSYYPENYDATKDHAIYFALPGWEGLYFQGVGANMQEPFPFEAQKYNSDMIIISPQLDDWGEESANDTIALVEYFLNNVNIDESKVYISGASGGGETLSIVLGKRPELFTSALFISSQWDGDLNVLANARTPLYIVIGENDSYYGSENAKNAYNSLYEMYENQGLSQDQINDILVLDVKQHDYFSSRGISDEHAGLGIFAYDEDVMSWLFNKSK